MKWILLVIVASWGFEVFAETPHEYRTRKAFEAGEDSADTQVHAIRECAVSKIQGCVYPIIAHLKKEGKENATLRRESANALGRLRAIEARDTLLAILPKETDKHTKAAIIRALGLIANKADIKTIAGFLGDNEIAIRHAAARALFEFDDKQASSEAAGKIAGEKDDFVRVELLNAAILHDRGKVDHAFALGKILLSQDRAARLRAAEVMGVFPNKETLPDLERAYKVEPDREIRGILHQAILVTNLAQ